MSSKSTVLSMGRCVSNTLHCLYEPGRVDATGMSTDVRVEVLIRRARPEVATFMFEPRNDGAWTTGVVRVTPLTEGRLRAGSKVERTAKFLGREFSYLYEVVAAESDRFVEMRVEQPFPMQIRYELQETPEGTLASIHATGDARGFFRLAGTLLNGMVRRNITRDLELLRKCVEASTDRPSRR